MLILFLGTTPAASVVTVPKVPTPSYHSVQTYDNLINVTNRVLDRTIRKDIIRIQTNHLTGETAVNSARRNLVAVETHCERRLAADGKPSGECSGK